MDCRPQLIVVGGPNGSGKTTVAMRYSSHVGLPYLGADAMAETLAPTSPASVRIQAGRQYLKAVEEQIRGRQGCVIESTLAGRTLRPMIQEAIDRGFEVAMVFLFVDSPDICVARVAERVRKGGHDVPEEDIRRRFRRSIENFWQIYRYMADTWVLVYNGGSQLQDVSIGTHRTTVVRDSVLQEMFSTLIGSRDDQ